MADGIIASGDGIEFAPGVTYIKNWQYDCFEGTAQALEAAGLIHADQLPGAPGMPKVGVTFYDGQRPAKGVPKIKNETYINVIRRAGGKYGVRRGLSDAVKVEREAERRAEQEAQRAAAKAALSAREAVESDLYMAAVDGWSKIYSMVHTPDQYRLKMVNALRKEVRSVRDRDILGRQQHGFSMCDEVAAGLDELLDQMIDLIVGAEVQFDAGEHKAINDRALKAAQRHPYYREEVEKILAKQGNATATEEDEQ